MSIAGAVIVPHPPLIIPTVGRGQEREVQATIDAYRAAARQTADWAPEVLIVTSPHCVMYTDYFHISPGKGASGDMSAFGAPQTRLEAKYDGELRDEVIRQARPTVSGPELWGRETPLWITELSSPCTFSGKRD